MNCSKFIIFKSNSFFKYLKCLCSVLKRKKSNQKIKQETKTNLLNFVLNVSARTCEHLIKDILLLLHCLFSESQTIQLLYHLTAAVNLCIFAVFYTLDWMHLDWIVKVWLTFFFKSWCLKNPQSKRQGIPWTGRLSLAGPPHRNRQ